METYKDLLETEQYVELQDKMSKSVLFNSIEILKTINDRVTKYDEFDIKMFTSVVKDLNSLKKKTTPKREKVKL